MSELGEILRRLRGNMSLREAAKRSGLSYSYISSLESGKHPRTGDPIKPSPESLKALAKAYPNSSYSELMKVAGYLENLQDIKDDEILEKKNALIEKIFSLPEAEQKLINDMVSSLLKNKTNNE
ncbi:helix-turn-helix domain-containing protein [Paenibacillus sp. KR2-11]|uniref:helix-turn-helix domain-containing protein n=1 Tax=Paenibacillus sp. KR2-11 TaxID=3385500 RepID=UPI0038FCAE94